MRSMLLSRCSVAISLRQTNIATRRAVVSATRCVRREAIRSNLKAETKQLVPAASASKPRRRCLFSASATSSSSSDSPSPSGESNVILLKVEGMVCSKCTDRVENALMAAEGVSDARADLATGDVKVTLGGSSSGSDDGNSAASLAALVEEAGFGATVVEG